MLVDSEDGRCRTCKTGRLTIVDADDVTMTVERDESGDTYDVEIDAFRDGCMKYYFPYMLARQEEEASDAQAPCAKHGASFKLRTDWCR